ncbi:hypothetical protein A374_10023 [Fictibacillus macauensis ZFHKF-1]|uniref:Lipoprotein n=1 Tax=Fictibacillus macauensis ZFHKF-1 TaxID=1196324 RepID=I8J1G0_9BACL|nr:hypothetical protein [Fictibacillus macauensis]EIT85566.1 hypothetical protein A374_10023 [Fictibacillus macauensis ZFHKF-1]
MNKKMWVSFAVTGSIVLSGCSMNEKTIVSKQKTNDTAKHELKSNEKTEAAPAQEKKTFPEEVNYEKLPEIYDTLAPEAQLGTVNALLYKVTVTFDMSIGNAEVLIQNGINQNIVDSVKYSLKKSEGQYDQKLRKQVALAYQLLNQSDLSDQKGIKKLIDTHKDYMKIVDQMIGIIHKLSVKNAGASRKKMNHLKLEYLEQAKKNAIQFNLLVQHSSLDQKKYQDFTLKELKKINKEMASDME